MKKTSFFIISFLGILFISCKKTPDNKPVPKVTSDSYLPVTTGSNWKYLNIVNGVADTVTVKITGEPYWVVNSQATFQTASVTSAKGNNHNQYFYVGIDSTKKETYYLVRSEVYLYGTPSLFSPFEVPLGDNDLHTAEVKTTRLTDNALFAMLSVRCVDTLIETGISKTVNGNTFDHVLHTRAYFQRQLPWLEWQNMFVYDFYLAKGVGIVEIDVNSTYNQTLTGKETLIDYKLK